jgi:hypothetical protein
MGEMKRMVLLVVAACGGSGQVATNATATTSSAPPAASSAQAVPEDTSPPSIGTRHKKVGNGWFLSGSGKEFYEAIYEPGAEPRVVLKQQSDPRGRWVALMKNVSSGPYAGKKIRVRLGVKTAGVTGRGEMWARASAPHSPEDAPSTTTKLDPASEMKTYEVTIDVPENARVVEYGVGLAGDGLLWVGKDTIDVVP